MCAVNPETFFCIDLSRDQFISLEGVSRLVDREFDCLRGRNDHAACKEVKAHFWFNFIKIQRLI